MPKERKKELNDTTPQFKKNLVVTSKWLFFYLYPELVGLHFLLSTLGLNTLAFWNLHYIKILLVNKQKNKSMLALILKNFCSN